MWQPAVLAVPGGYANRASADQAYAYVSLPALPRGGSGVGHVPSSGVN